MKRIKPFFSLIPALILWLMFSVLLWGFVFTRITDTVPQKKLVLCIDAQVPDPTSLAVELEAFADPGIRMVKAHSFSYAMMSGDVLRSADLYIVKESDIASYSEWFAPLPPELSGEQIYAIEDVPYGVLIYDAERQTGAAQEYINYFLPSETPENCYLMFGIHSVHIASHENAIDNAAVDLAYALLNQIQ